MKLLRYLFLLITCVSVVQVLAQKKTNRLQPGKIYSAGEKIYAPRYGFNATIPEDWEGMLPRESEVFLLTPTGAVFGEIYIYALENMDLTSLKAAWIKGVDLSESIRLKAVNPTLEGDLLYSEGIGEGDKINKGNKAFAVARPTTNGACIVAISIMPVQFFEPIKNTLLTFMRNSTLGEPSNASPYADLNWEELLSGKSLITYMYGEGGSKDTEIDLCKDGSFTATIKKSGFMKNQNADYHGRLMGTWRVEGTGESTKLTFTFTGKKKLAPIEAVLTIQEDKIFSGGERYSVGQSLRCK